MARPPEMLRLLDVRVADRRFGLDADFVQEVLRAVRIRALPGAPEAVEGLIDYRGSPLPVYDVRARFGLPRRPLHPHDHLIVARAATRRVVLRVDRVEDLVEISPDVIRPVELLEGGSEICPGVVALPDGLLLIHDPARFLRAEERARLDAAMAAGGGDAGEPVA